MEVEFQLNFVFFTNYLRTVAIIFIFRVCELSVWNFFFLQFLLLVYLQYKNNFSFNIFTHIRARIWAIVLKQYIQP